MELYKKYRPRKLETLVGQDEAVRSLRKLIEQKRIPHAILLSGPSGCGKTTIARILKRELQCGDADFVELNCADFKGIDTVRDIRRQTSMRPIEGPVRMWLIDEAHKLTNDAQNALLKLLEDTPKHVYFVLATTDPQKLIRTIVTRCTEIRLKPLSRKDLLTLLRRVLHREGVGLSEDILEEIVQASDGSARKALVILEQVMGLTDEEEQRAAIQAASVNKDAAIELARTLIRPRPAWADVAKLLKTINDDPEAVRHLVLSYCRTVLLSGGPQAARAFRVIDVFSDNFYDSKHAGLAAACYEVVHFE